MKQCCILLCSIILFLVAIPTIKLLHLCNKVEITCCSQKCNSSTENNESDSTENCDGNFCNPFSICCCCVLHVFSINNYTLLKPIVSLTYQNTYNSEFTSQFSVDFWQPPKLV